MAEFQDFPIKTDPDELLADFIAELRTFWPNWEPNEGSLLYRAAASFCRIIAQGRDVAALVPGEIFRTAGRSLFNIFPNEGTQATVDTTWTMIDNAGYTVPAGAILAIQGVLFETVADIVIPNGAVAATPVAIRALDEGSAASGLGAVGDHIVLEEALPFVLSVVLLGSTANGVDAEDIDAYTTRLRETLTLLTMVAILPADLAKLAKTVIGVERVAVIDNYDASTSTAGVPGHATISPIDAAGANVPTLVKDAVLALVTAGNRRLINAAVHVINPTRTPVDITLNGVIYPNSDVAESTAAVLAALQSFLSPANWGRAQSESGDDRAWLNKSVVSMFDIAAAADMATGLDRITGLTVGLNGGVQVAGDQALPGVAPLPSVGAIVVNLVAP